MIDGWGYEGARYYYADVVGKASSPRRSAARAVLPCGGGGSGRDANVRARIRAHAHARTHVHIHATPTPAHDPPTASHTSAETKMVPTRAGHARTHRRRHTLGEKRETETTRARTHARTHTRTRQRAGVDVDGLAVPLVLEKQAHLVVGDDLEVCVGVGGGVLRLKVVVAQVRRLGLDLGPRFPQGLRKK
jgi:hypothetical protein